MHAMNAAVAVSIIGILFVSQMQLSAAAPAFRVQLGERQLFLDDVGIAKTDNLNHTMHQPAKKGAVMRPDWPTGQRGLQVRSGPFWDPQDKVFKFWVHAICRTSPDGLHWDAACKDRSTGLRGEVFYDPTDPDPARRYKSFNPAQLAVSPDGKTWTVLKVPRPPVGDEFNFSIDGKKRLYIASLKGGGPYGRSVFLSTSEDFERWTKPELIFHADELDQKLGRENIKARFADATLQQPSYNIPSKYKVDVYNMGIFRYEGLYIGLPAMFHRTGQVSKDWPGFNELPIPPVYLPGYRQSGDWSGFHDVQLACSRDLRNWSRLGGRRPFIGSSPVGAGAYDLACVMPPSSAIVRGDELWFYYTGGMSYGLVLTRGAYEHGICLAVLRRDGFVSLGAGQEEGTIVTKPFKAPGEKLFVNFDGGLKGRLRVEALGKNGKVLAASAPMKGDLLHEQVKWQKGGIADCEGKVVGLRFTLCDGQFYSYWFK